MRFYVGFDDTDTLDSPRGTGKLARLFAARLPEGAGLWGVVRQQLPVLEGIPFTHKNSSACVVVEGEDPSLAGRLVELAAQHLAELFVPGSDPGLCVMTEGSPSVAELVAFGRECCTRIVAQADALRAARGAHLSGHGGTNDGIIGAAAGVGLTVYGWSGRLIEFGGLRDFPEDVPVRDLEARRIRVLCTDRDALVPGPDDLVETRGWLRPNLWGASATLPVTALGDGRWRALGIKSRAAGH